MKVAIVGRRNTGKSTFVNTLAQAERMIVSEVPGTTRDSVDVRFELDGKTFVAIDTPGMRRTKSIQTDIDFYGLHRAQRSIRRADVVLLFFDATQRISKVDKQLAEYIAEQYKPCIFVVNKWDLLVGRCPPGSGRSTCTTRSARCTYVPIAFITGQTGKNVKALLQPRADAVQAGAAARDHRPAQRRGAATSWPPTRRRCTIRAGRRSFTPRRSDVEPPTIVLFCNNPQAFSPSYRRYLLTALRDRLPFAEVPIRLYLRRREETRGGEATKPTDRLARGTSDGRIDAVYVAARFSTPRFGYV